MHIIKTMNALKRAKHYQSIAQKRNIQFYASLVLRIYYRYYSYLYLMKGCHNIYAAIQFIICLKINCAFSLSSYLTENILSLLHL